MSRIIFVCDKNQSSVGKPELDTIGVCCLKASAGESLFTVINYYRATKKSTLNIERA